jgi:hypothetical protein
VHVGLAVVAVVSDLGPDAALRGAAARDGRTGLAVAILVVVAVEQARARATSGVRASGAASAALASGLAIEAASSTGVSASGE